MGLNRYEQETIITFSAGDPVVRVWTAQRSVISQLRKREAFRLVDEGEFDGSPWARFEASGSDWTLWSGVKRRVNLSDEQRESLRDRLAAGRNA